jgi:hypothetical protein
VLQSGEDGRRVIARADEWTAGDMAKAYAASFFGQGVEFLWMVVLLDGEHGGADQALL